MTYEFVLAWEDYHYHLLCYSSFQLVWKASVSMAPGSGLQLMYLSSWLFSQVAIRGLFCKGPDTHRSCGMTPPSASIPLMSVPPWIPNPQSGCSVLEGEIRTGWHPCVDTSPTSHRLSSSSWWNEFPPFDWHKRICFSTLLPDLQVFAERQQGTEHNSAGSASVAESSIC